ncbi:unnamed protein product [Effrenium voratum]|nr:unnamed protein product [Effrenium voratum]
MAGEVLSADTVCQAVLDEVRNVEVIDVHTHLLPPSHGKLMLWGIDELLTYHYLVSEYFMVAPAEVTHDNFFAKSKQGQADLVWRGLFVERSPISEACQGVVTTLQKLGLEKQLAERDLTSIRQWFEAQRLDDHVEKVFQLANVRYAVMTNIPYVEEEAQHWRQNAPVATSRLRTALRIDTFLKGDWGSISKALRAEGLDETLEGAKEYLRKWARIYKPEYMMASTPHDWRYPEPPAVATMKPLVKAFAGFGAAELLEQVVAPLCQELSLPIALKLGAWRGMSPDLDPCCGGDGVAAADLASLQVLSRANQHELTAGAPGWYCNNPSIIEELTKMRTEMLGTAFTAQHSDCRVLEQLLYKWEHSREVIGEALAPYYRRLLQRGWRLTRQELRRDVQLLLGGSYEAFMAR